MKTTTLALAAALACNLGMAQAAEYYVVVPLPSRAAPIAITVALNGMALPAGRVGAPYAEVNFHGLLQVSGDPGFSGAGVRWAISQGTLPAGLALDGTTGRLAGTPTNVTTAQGQGFEISAVYKTKEGRQQYSVAVTDEPGSCREQLARNPGASSGWYTLDADGAGPVPAQEYFCDMTSAGGGWTRVVRQFEQSPVTNWNGGVNGPSYALAQGAIPAHSQVAFGRDDSATDIDYGAGTYSATDIEVTSVTSPKTGRTYQMHRNSVGHYSDHNPESTYADKASAFSGTLTFDQVGGSMHTWAFSPSVSTPADRGYSYAGGRYGQADAFAWSVWVR
jgi:hypothetical protein